MTEQEFHQHLRRRLSQTSIGASSIRRKGAAELLKILRSYFENRIDLEEFRISLADENGYRTFLCNHTEDILTDFPDPTHNWGLARKGLNLFLREIV